jgi:hypothetical protein
MTNAEISDVIREELGKETPDLDKCLKLLGSMDTADKKHQKEQYEKETY